jgi:hypothetical protein
MIEPASEVKITFDTLYETDEWVLRKAHPSKSTSIPIWLSHCCASGPAEDKQLLYTHRHWDGHAEYDRDTMRLSDPCKSCGSVVPEGMVALYEMMRMGHE